MNKPFFYFFPPPSLLLFFLFLFPRHLRVRSDEVAGGVGHVSVGRVLVLFVVVPPALLLVVENLLEALSLRFTIFVPRNDLQCPIK